MYSCDVFTFFIDVVLGVQKNEKYMLMLQNTLFDPPDDSVDL